MENIPLEIYQAVYDALEAEDYGKLRSVSKYSHEVAMLFLMSEIHLTFKNIHL